MLEVGSEHFIRVNMDGCEGEGGAGEMEGLDVDFDGDEFSAEGLRMELRVHVDLVLVIELILCREFVFCMEFVLCIEFVFCIKLVFRLGFVYG